MATEASLGLRIGFWGCSAIAAAVVIRRLVVLAAPPQSGPPELLKLDQVFAQHAALTLAHILPALFFVVIAPVVVFRKARWAERLVYPVGAVVGLTAYFMAAHSVGGWVEQSAVVVFDTVFLYSLWRAYRERGDEAERRRWLLRAIVVLLGIATTRPVMGAFFATSRLTHWTPSQFFGFAFWIGFSINWIVVEAWLRRK